MADALRHAEPVEQVLASLESGPDGLTDAEVERRLARYGPNRLPRARTVSAFRILLDQFRSVVVVLLLAAAGIAVVMGDGLEATAIAAVLVINSAIGFVTELQARRAMDALLELDVLRAIAIREGRVRGVDAHMLVPGDLMVLEAGRHVAADGRVVDATDLRIDEAPLTGESLPVSKSADVLPAGTALADRVNMVYKGTTVVAGTARVVVTATGPMTELGHIGALTGGVREESTPLERRLDELGRRLVWLAIGVGALVAAVGALQGGSVALMIETGIALAVAAVPEALPAVATIALAVGVRRMAHRHALVRRLPAVEALGSTTVVCTDKTRTLTSGDMTVVRVWAGDTDAQPREAAGDSGVGASRLRHALEVAALASRVQAGHEGVDRAQTGDPVDVAMLHAASLAGIDRAALAAARPGVGLVPFSTERKLMATFHQVDGVVVAYVKGAPRQVLAASTRGPDGTALDDAGRARLNAVNERFARAGLRVIALSSGPVEAADTGALRGLAFAGFVGLMDPPASGVKETIATLKAAGLRTVMLTGDQRLTAEAVGRELGLLTSGEQVVGTDELAAMSQEALADRAGRIGAFSRISPGQKLAVVEALQSRGEIVAMLGDGINDAPALKKADVGVAMGRRGTDVAKEAASIVLQDDRFETIAAAVEEGRVIFDNIRKFVFYLFSCNVAEVLVLLGAGLIGLPMPLMPLQLLWLNMVTDTFPALALALEPGDPGVMRRPPRDPREAILSRAFVLRILFYGGMITVSTLAAFRWALAYAPVHAVTVAFTTLALAQVLHLGNARGEGPMLGGGRFWSNRYAVAAALVSVLLQLAALHLAPLAATLRVAPLSGEAWLVVIACSGAPAVVGQGVKYFGRRAQLGR
jgi:Ca2+-transporting ATPase